MFLVGGVPWDLVISYFFIRVTSKPVLLSALCLNLISTTDGLKWEVAHRASALMNVAAV